MSNKTEQGLLSICSTALKLVKDLLSEKEETTNCGAVIENMTLHDEDPENRYYVSERNFDDIVSDYTSGKQILLHFDRWSPEQYDGVTPPSVPLYTPVIGFFQSIEWSEEQQQDMPVYYLNCLQKTNTFEPFPGSMYGLFDTYGGEKDANGKLRFTIHSD